MKEELTEEERGELRELLTENIIERYDHSDYWDEDIIKEFYADCGVEL